MYGITVAENLKSRVPSVRLFCIECAVEYLPRADKLWEAMEQKAAGLASTLKTEEISSLPAIRASRNAYKACGKDPARYRLSAEALLRRVVKGAGLYQICNVVDLLNLVSVSTGFSIGGYDAEKICGPVEFGIGAAGEPYQGIGRGELNIEGLPVFRDEKGAFGTPTSDSERTCVDENTRRFLMIIIDFGGSAALEEAGQMACDLLRQYAAAQSIEIKIVE